MALLCCKNPLFFEKDAKSSKEKLKLENLLKDNPTALCNLGIYYFNDCYGVKDRSKAAKIFGMAVKFGDERAAFYLAQLLEVGDGIPKNLEKAKEFFYLAAKSHYFSEIAKIHLGKG